MGFFKNNLMKKIVRKKKKENNEIQHPDNSNKIYKSKVLENGLAVLMISDPNTSVSAAAMSVKFGSFDDPPDMQGLAHIMEHMFFNGSTKVTQENEFRNLVKMHGGEVFAKTEQDFTGFSFMIKNDHFKVGLEMFGHMFNEPLMDINVLKEEIKTLNSEFESQKYKDCNRMEQLLSHTSPKDHPFNKFTWGNKKSLSSKEPQALRDHALKLFRERFIGANMKLVIIGSEAVNELEDLVMECFSSLKRGPKIDFVFPKYKDNLWKYGVSYTLESLEDAQSMRITWIIPPISLSHSKIRPQQLIHNLISDESEGSLCYFFKSKHWITSFNASVGHEFAFSDVGDCSFTSTAGGQLFYINLDMTNNGLNHYLHLLRTCGSSTLLLSLIKDYKLSLEMKFQCMDVDHNQLDDPINFPLALAANMLSFPVSHAISLDFRYEFGDLTAVQDMVRNFTTNNMRIDLLTKSFTKDEEYQEEPYFSSKYKEEPIPHHYLQKWETSQDVDVDPALHFPQRNSFMPTTSFWRDVSAEENLDADYYDETYDEENTDSDEMEETPFQTIIVDDNNKLVYRHEDGILSTARFKIYMNVSPGVFSHMVSRIYFEMLKDEVSPILCKGGDAYIYSQLSFGDDNTIEIELYGYAGSFSDFMCSLCEKFRTFVPTPEAFESITEKMLRQFYLTSRDLDDHAKKLLSEFIIEGHFSMDEKFNAMKSISFEHLKAFLPETKQIRVAGLFSGRFSEHDCRQILGLFKPIGKFEIPRKLVTMKELALNSPYTVSAKPITEIQSNSLAKVYYQMSCDEGSKDFNSDKVSAFLHLLKAMVDEKLHCDLRLKQRLGYIAECDVHNLHGVQGFYFYVVSCDHKAKGLLKEIHSFVATMRDYLASVDDDTFNCYRSGVDLPGDYDMFPDLIDDDDDRCVNGYGPLATLCLAKMKKEDVLKLYDRFFVQKRSIVEVCIGSRDVITSLSKKPSV